MNVFKRWKTRIINWEFWPFWIFYFPVFFYFFWLSIRNRSFFFFTATDPLMDFGGMSGEEKWEIFKSMPKESYPETILINDESRSDLLELAQKMGFPLVVKPNIGERGRRVEIIRSVEELNIYASQVKVDFLLQVLVDYPIELGVFYIRHPNEEFGQITSIVMKKFLSVVGDGQRTVRSLLADESRAMLQLDFEHSRFSQLMNTIPFLGEEIIVEHIGNHCRGTMFLDATHEADDRLNMSIDKLAKEVDGFYYGRFDLRCASFDDLRKLKNYKVVELNGVGAEPGHIYQPGFSLLKAYKIVFWHFQQMAEIARQNNKLGISSWTFRRGIKKMLDIRTYNRRLNPE
jgi:hypothetical protein